VHFIAEGHTPPTEYPGTQIAPAAASGNLWVYENHRGNSTFEEIFADSTGEESIDPYGFRIFFTTSGSGRAWDYGTWAVTG
jgi:hypothetical protein